MKHLIVRAVCAIFLASNLVAHSTFAAEPSLAPITKYQLVYNAALVHFEQPLAQSQIAQFAASTASPGVKAGGVDEAVKILAGDAAYEIMNYGRIVTGDGVPGSVTHNATHYILKVEERVSADGQIKSTIARAEPQRVGFDLTVSPAAAGNEPENTVSTKAHIRHGVVVSDDEEVSTVVAEGEASLGLGSFQAITWTNAGQLYALVLSLDTFDRHN